MKKPQFIFYRDDKGHCEFEEFLSSLPENDLDKLLSRLNSIEEIGLLDSIRLKYVKKLESNLYEVRSIRGSNHQRAIYFHKEDNVYIITHGFTKKTNKTPKNEIEKGIRIRKNYFSNERNE